MTISAISCQIGNFELPAGTKSFGWFQQGIGDLQYKKTGDIILSVLYHKPCRKHFFKRKKKMDRNKHDHEHVLMGLQKPERSLMK